MRRERRIGERIGAVLTLAVLTLAVALAAMAAPPKKVAPLRFNRDIRPILAENCYTCHGMDADKRMAGLRLDERAAALARKAIVPGKPERSSIIERIQVRDARQMPPVHSRKSLTPRQKTLLARWVREGAVYEPHWAFVRLPERVPVPKVANAQWPRNYIDSFVLARLEKERLFPSPEASRSTYLRRVTLDLTGLLPTPAETDAFLNDTAPDAFEKVVDRLLASPRFGEKMASIWLDVARYADSYGYQSDQLSPTWPYRDWVIRAFNENMPYHRFITEQLAGDLLPDANRETRLATAFNRLHRMTNEGGSVPEEWRQEGVADRVQTFGMAFLGLTAECARCHDHKYDPVTQRDFYSLAAFFNNIDEHGLYDQGGIVPTPSLLLPDVGQAAALSSAKAAVIAAERSLASKRAERETEFRKWQERSPVPTSPDGADWPDLIGRFDFETVEGNKLINLVPGATKQGERAEGTPLTPDERGNAVALDGENHIRFPELGRFTRHTPFTIAFRMKDARLTEGEAVVFQACSGTDTGPYGYDLTVRDGYLTARIMRHWPGNAIAVRTRQPVPKNAWTHVAVTYNGSSRAAGLRIYVNGDAAPVSVVRDRLYKGTGAHTLVFGQRFRDKGFKGGRIDDVSIFERDLSAYEVLFLAKERPVEETPDRRSGNEKTLREYYFSAIDPETRAAAKALTAAREQQVRAEEPAFEISVMEEMPGKRPTYRLARGRYDAPVTEKDRVYPRTPAGILAYPRNLRRDRLGLAQWLTHPAHPLTARVAVNRFWAICFGRGLVETQEDFGIQGKPPTHPELLDYLARDFVRSGWNVKRLLKRIVLSQTYRQSSTQRPDLRTRDPQNLLLARGPSHRLTAEEIRDIALGGSGLLFERIGGPPVSPYQPGDLWRESNSMSPAYQQSKGPDLYRRSLYTVRKRTAPMPNMTVFDAVSREVCTARRSTTNTPLQALVLLNDTQFLEAARALGQRTLKEAGPTTPQRVTFAFRLLAVREPTARELMTLIRLYDDQRAIFAADPEAARKLIAIGESLPDPSLAPTDLAAATVLAQAVLNLDAVVWKR
ncbi:MAG: DUF1553 domain-containing protein [Capsulimonadales bacterium]|nr:DUF1553 domain-containing protein [Capsulimonadales bacterium]